MENSASESRVLSGVDSSNVTDHALESEFLDWPIRRITRGLSEGVLDARPPLPRVVDTDLQLFGFVDRSLSGDADVCSPAPS